MILDEYGSEDRIDFSWVVFFRSTIFNPCSIIIIIMGGICLRHLNFRRSKLIQADSLFGYLPTRRRNLLQQSVEVFPFDEAVVVHWMTNGIDLPGADPISERVWRNSQIVCCLGYPHVIR